MKRKLYFIMSTIEHIRLLSKRTSNEFWVQLIISPLIIMKYDDEDEEDEIQRSIDRSNLGRRWETFTAVYSVVDYRLDCLLRKWQRDKKKVERLTSLIRDILPLLVLVICLWIVVYMHQLQGCEYCTYASFNARHNDNCQSSFLSCCYHWL